MKRMLFTVLIFIWASQGSIAQTSTVEQEIIQLSKNKWQWMADKNIEALSKLFHEKAIFVHMGNRTGNQHHQERRHLV